jgi:hypothetical protein
MVSPKGLAPRHGEKFKLSFSKPLNPQIPKSLNPYVANVEITIFDMI